MNVMYIFKEFTRGRKQNDAYIWNVFHEK